MIGRREPTSVGGRYGVIRKSETSSRSDLIKVAEIRVAFAVRRPVGYCESKQNRKLALFAPRESRPEGESGLAR